MPHFRTMTTHFVREKWYPRRLIAVASGAKCRPPIAAGSAACATDRRRQDSGTIIRTRPFRPEPKFGGEQINEVTQGIEDHSRQRSGAGIAVRRRRAGPDR